MTDPVMASHAAVTEMTKLNIVEKVIALEGVDLFESLTPDQLARVASVAEELRTPGETLLLDRDKPVDAFYVILDGAVEIAKAGSALHTAGPGDVLGAWALFDSTPMTVTAKVSGDARLLRIRRDDFHDLLSDNREIMARLFSTLVRRFRALVEP